MTALGKNTVSTKQLLGFIERLERLAAEKSAIGEDEKVVMAEAKAAGFTPKLIRYCVKVRATRPHDWEEWCASRDMYLHAIGIEDTPPLFRAAGLMDVDINIHEQVVEVLKTVVPAGGDIIITRGASATRLFRDPDGTAQSEELEQWPPTAPAPAKKGGRKKKSGPVLPDANEADAEEMGAVAYAQNQPINLNPFPFGDKRRGAWDRGWRSASGTDGMGPDEDQEN